jgi:hypothetical protein
VRGGYGKSLLRRRGELVERSFAHCYETGGMRRTHLRGHENILKRQLLHVGAFNLSLILRQVLGTGTPRQWKDRKTSRERLFCYSFATYSSGKSKSAPRKPNLNILYEIGHRITRLDSQLGAAGRAENQLLPPRAASRRRVLAIRL